MKKMRVLEPHKGLVYGYLVPLLTISLFILLLGISFFTVYVNTKIERGDLIAQEVEQIVTIVHRIDATCGISAIQGKKIPINFLTVKKDGFVGSEIGALALVHPEKWEGPYVPRNIEMEGVPYQLIYTHSGYFVTPGDGVTLPNGKIMGKDIIIDDSANMALLTAPGKPLNFHGKMLALPLRLETITADAPVFNEDFIIEE